MLIHFLTSVLVACVVLMSLFPHTPAARAIRGVLVERPARFLMDMTWAKAGQLALSATALAVMLAVPEVAMLIASMGADAAIVEVMIVVWVASASSGFASVLRSAGQTGRRALRITVRMVRAVTRPRARRLRPGRRPQGRKDDADGRDWTFA